MSSNGFASRAQRAGDRNSASSGGNNQQAGGNKQQTVGNTRGNSDGQRK